MSTAPVVHGTTSPQSNAFTRFIDAIGALWRKAEPVVKGVEEIAVDLEPALALTPAGPEYGIAVNAIVSAQQVAEAALSAGTTLSTAQKAQIAVNAATPALNTILTSKGVTANRESVITTWIQNVFNILAGPVVSSMKTEAGQKTT